MRILIASPIDGDAVEALRAHHDVVVRADGVDVPALIGDREVVVFRSGVDLDRDTLRAAPDLKLLIRAGSGLDNVDLEEMRRRDIELVRIAAPGAQAVAELTFALMLGVARHVVRADRSVRAGAWEKRELAGTLLHRKTLGIVGAGNIGRRVGAMGAAWGMSVLGCVEAPSPRVARGLARDGIELCDFDAVVEHADVLTLHVPLTSLTRHLIDGDVMARMKPGSFLLNLARGGVVDEQALYEVLRQGDPIRGAALDVHEIEGPGIVSPLASLPNVVLTPHIGSMATEAQQEIGRRVLAAVHEFAARSSDEQRLTEGAMT